jgi:ABC-2 type transport system permease protein
MKNTGGDTRRRVRLLLFGLIGVCFWLGILAITLRVLRHIVSIVDIGDMLAYKLLSMVFIVFFSLLIFSSLLACLSKLYLSRDLALVHAFPLPPAQVFLSRWIESTFDSAWMVLVYSIPVLVSFGIIFHAGPFFYLQMGLALIPFCILASGISAWVILVTVILLPAKRIRSILVFMGLLAFIVLYVAFRLLKPERLVDPEAFSSILLYIQSLSTPASPLLPTTWILDSMKAALTGNTGESFFHLALLWSGALFMGFLATATAKSFYFKGFSKSQTSAFKLIRSDGQWLFNTFSWLSGSTRAFLVKEIKTFLRDQTQWSQLFLIAALIVIYLYNFSVLPLEKSPIKTLYLQNLLAFLNMGLAAFVLVAVTARFAFPSVSLEGSAFWIIRSYPVSIRSFLLIKYFIYLTPLLLLGELLVVAANLLLNATPFMMALSCLTLLGITPGVVALGVGLGAAYPDFSSENPTQTVTGFGGVLFMLLATAFIAAVLILEAGPVYRIFLSDIKGNPLTAWDWVWIWGAFSTDLVLSLLTVYLPLRFGEKSLALVFPESHRP